MQHVGVNEEGEHLSSSSEILVGCEYSMMPSSTYSLDFRSGVKVPGKHLPIQLSIIRYTCI